MHSYMSGFASSTQPADLPHHPHQALSLIRAMVEDVYVRECGLTFQQCICNYAAKFPMVEYHGGLL